MNSNIKLASTRSSSAVTGFAANSTNVYHGPDSSNYAKVGSIGPNETVNILAQSMGWYHIEYTVNGTSQRKTGYVPKSSLTNVSSSNISEEDFYGGYCYAVQQLDVRTCDVFANTASMGKLFINEGCTFLFSYLVNGVNIAFIEYATSSGTKRGYVESDKLIFPCETIVCIANETIPVYGGPDFNSSAQLGTIYVNELMSVVAKNGSVIYVEYNTTKGRKRGYVDWAKVNPRDYNSSIVFNNFYAVKSNSNCHIADESVAVPVYGGPSTSYAQIGSVNCENIVCFWTQNASYAPLTCIEYTVNTTGKIKRGYIDPSKVHNNNLANENNPLEDLTVEYTHFERSVYGKTQLNRDMVCYKTGDGPNRIFLTFALHGWEDGKKADGTYYHGDGNMLIKIAKRFMQKFATLPSSKISEIKNKWTILVFPGINLDGIVNGYSINGFGRCLNSGLDPNRNWPGNFKVNTSSSRYKTGNKYLGNKTDYSDAIELVNLKNKIVQNAATTGEKILIDVHGWLNQTVGNQSLGQCYWDEFGIPASRHSYGYGEGYLIAWAKNSINGITSVTDEPGISAKTCLLELPPTTNYSDSNINSYGDKFFNSTLKILESNGVYPENNSEASFETLFNQLQLLYEFASEYSPTSSVKERNTLVLQYLRNLHYSSFYFERLYGTTDKNFLTYVNDRIEERIDINQNYLHQDNIKVPDPYVPSGIIIDHLAACLNGYLHDFLPITSFERDLNNLGCWAGDLVQMGEVFQKIKDLTVEEAANIIAVRDYNVVKDYKDYGITNISKCGFSYPDWTHDVDAVCLKDALLTTPIYQAFSNYYTDPNQYNYRHHTFIQKTIPNGSINFYDIYSYVKPYLMPENLASIQYIWDLFRGYNGRNIEALAQGFANKLLAFYYDEEPDNPGPVTPTIPNITYNAYCQNYEWHGEKSNGEMAGAFGQSLRVEAVIINADINIQYRVHMEGIGWGPWVPNGCMAGTTGESRRIEAIEIQSSKNVLVGQGYVQDIGYQSEVRGTQIVIGTTGQGLRLEGFSLKFE